MQTPECFAAAARLRRFLAVLVTGSLLAAPGVFLAPGLAYSAAGDETGPASASPEEAASDPAQGPAGTTEQETERPGRTGLPLPRFVSLRASEVNLRTGPGIRYPIEWVYKRRDLPVEVVDEFESWRRIRDWEGTLGWVHQSMLRGRRTALILAQPRLLRAKPEEAAPAVAQLEVGVVGEIAGCGATWCRLTAGGFEGWLRRDEFFGVYPDETLK